MLGGIKMLYNKKGDLLDSDCTVIMHQANCFKTMGAGIAKSIAEKYPEAYLADKSLPLSPAQRLGRFSYAKAKDGKTIVNLYGQYGCGKGIQTNYDKLESAIYQFFTKARKDSSVNLEKVGVPYKIGCGLAGGDWDIVKSILSRQSELHKITIYIYEL